MLSRCATNAQLPHRHACNKHVTHRLAVHGRCHVGACRPPTVRLNSSANDRQNATEDAAFTSAALHFQRLLHDAAWCGDEVLCTCAASALEAAPHTTTC